MAQKLLKGRVLDQQNRPLNYSLTLNEREVAENTRAVKLLVITPKGNVGWLSRDAFKTDAQVDPDALHSSIEGEIYALPADTPTDGDIFVFEDKSVGYKKRKVLWETLVDTALLSSTLQLAYDGGGTALGRTIDVSPSTADPVRIQSDNVLAAWMLHLDWDVSGDLSDNPVGQAIIESNRLLDAGADGVSDSYVNFEVTRRNKINLSGQTFTDDGAVLLARMINTVTDGTVVANSDIIQVTGPAAGTWNGHYLGVGLNSDDEYRVAINRTGHVLLGPGGATAPDIALVRDSAGILDIQDEMTTGRIGINIVPVAASGLLQLEMETDVTNNDQGMLIHGDLDFGAFELGSTTERALYIDLDWDLSASTTLANAKARGLAIKTNVVKPASNPAAYSSGMRPFEIISDWEAGANAQVLGDSVSDAPFSLQFTHDTDNTTYGYNEIPSDGYIHFFLSVNPSSAINTQIKAVSYDFEIKIGGTSTRAIAVSHNIKPQSGSTGIAVGAEYTVVSPPTGMAYAAAERLAFSSGTLAVDRRFALEAAGHAWVRGASALITDTAAYNLSSDHLDFTDGSCNLYVQDEAEFDGVAYFDAGFVHNELGGDVDARMEGDTDTDLFFLDASEDAIGISTNTPDATLHVAGDMHVEDDHKTDAGVVQAIEEISSNTTLDNTHHTVLCDASTASFTVTLPAAANHTGRVYRIVKIDSDGTKTVTIDGNSSETINGLTTWVLAAQYEGVTIQSDGTEWFILP